MSCIIMSCMAVDVFYRNVPDPPQKREKRKEYGTWYARFSQERDCQSIDQIILENDELWYRIIE